VLQLLLAQKKHVHTYESLNDIDIYTQRGTDCPLEIEEELVNGIEK